MYDVVEWIRHLVVDCVRFLGLRYSDQLALTPPFTSVFGLAEEALESAIRNLQGPHAHDDVLTSEQLRDVQGLFDCLTKSFDPLLSECKWPSQ